MKKEKDSLIIYRDDLKQFLDKKIQIRGRVVRKETAYRKGSSKSNKEFIRLLLKDVELVKQKRKLNSHLNIYFISNTKYIDIVENNDVILIEGVVRRYKTWKKVEGIFVMVLNYGLNENKILSIEKDIE